MAECHPPRASPNPAALTILLTESPGKKTDK
jgi:hypothetical protein